MIHAAQVPRHIGVILDGNRRWAASYGHSAAAGHRLGGRKITEFLNWAQELGIAEVTLWLLSTDNLAREPAELNNLWTVIANTATELAEQQRWRIEVLGQRQLLPTALNEALDEAVVSTADLGATEADQPGAAHPGRFPAGATEADQPGAAAAGQPQANSGVMQVNLAVGYGGRAEIIDAVRAYLRERAADGAQLADVAAQFSEADLAAHLYNAGSPDVDLIIRTSGESRLGGFLLWQSSHAELYFADVLWPDFTRHDLERALEAYATRQRRLGR